MPKNSERSAGLSSYSPRQNVVRVCDDTSRTPAIQARGRFAGQHLDVVLLVIPVQKRG
jgi:hypothetical protein